MFEIITSSVGVSKQYRILMPFDELEIGQSFLVSFSEFFIKSESSLRSHVCKKGKQLGKKFSVIKRKDINAYEVARVE